MARYDNIESINGPSFTKKFQFYMFDGEVEIPVRENRPFFIWTFKDKQRSYVCQNKFVFPYNDRTMYTSYSKAHGGLQRENYIYPSTIIVTEKDRDKGFVKRYFAKNVFDTSIFEIDKATFSMELNFYHTTSLTWYLHKSKDMMKKKNRKQLELAKDSIDRIDEYLDPLEFYRDEVELTPENVTLKKLERLLHNPHGYSHESQASSTANALGLSGTHQMPDGSWMPGLSHEEYLQAMKKDTIETPVGSIPTQNLKDSSGY